MKVRTVVISVVTQESVRISVQRSIIYRGRASVSAGATAPLFIGYQGTSPLCVKSPIDGRVWN